MFKTLNPVHVIRTNDGLNLMISPRTVVPSIIFDSGVVYIDIDIYVLTIVNILKCFLSNTEHSYYSQLTAQLSPLLATCDARTRKESMCFTAADSCYYN